MTLQSTTGKGPSVDPEVLKVGALKKTVTPPPGLTPSLLISIKFTGEGGFKSF